MTSFGSWSVLGSWERSKDYILGHSLGLIISVDLTLTLGGGRAFF